MPGELFSENDDASMPKIDGTRQLLLQFPVTSDEFFPLAEMTMTDFLPLPPDCTALGIPVGRAI